MTEKPPPVTKKEVAARSTARRPPTPTQTITRPPQRTIDDTKNIVLAKMEQQAGGFVSYSYLIELLLKLAVRHSDHIDIESGANEEELLLGLGKAIAKGMIENPGKRK